MLNSDKDLVAFNIPAKYTLTQLDPVSGFEPGGCADVFVVMKQFDVRVGRLNIGVTVRQGNMGHMGFCQRPHENNIRRTPTHTQWKFPFGQTASTAYSFDEENPLQTDSSQRIFNAVCSCPGFTVRV